MRISDWSSDVCSSDLRDRLRIAAQYLAVDERRIADRFGKTADHAASQLLQPLFEIRAAERNRLHHEKQTLTRAGRLGQAALFDDFGEPFQLAAEWHLVAHLVEQPRQHAVDRALPQSEERRGGKE